MRRITAIGSLVLAVVLGGCATVPERAPLPSLAHAPVPDDAPLEDLAREALHRDGTDQRLERLARLDVVLELSFTKLLVGLAEDERPPKAEIEALTSRLGHAARGAFVPERLVERTARALAEADGSREHLRATLAFLRSDVYRRMAFARADAETPAGQRRMASYLSQLPNTPQDLARRDLLLRLLDATGEAELFFRLSHDVTRRFLEAAEPAFPEWAEEPYRAFKDDASSGADAFRAQVRKSLVLQAMYAYRKLSSGELEEAVRFWESAAGKGYARARILAVTQALEEAYVVVGERLAPGGNGVSEGDIAEQAGARADLPDVDELRQGLGRDTPREPL